MAKKKTNATPIKKEYFIEALEMSMGNISEACKKASVNRSTYYQWLSGDDEFKEKAEEVKEGLLDLTESALYRAINDGNVTAIIFNLKTRGRDRGYIETVHQVVDLSARDEFQSSLSEGAKDSILKGINK